MATEEIQHTQHEPRDPVIIVDDVEVRSSELVVSGRQVLELAGKFPPDDYIVYWLGRDNILQDLGLERTVHLREHRVDRFLTFLADRSFRFEIDGKREDWGCPIITVETLLKLAGAEEGARIWLRRAGEPDRIIGRGESVDLAIPGIEQFYVERILILEIVNEDNGVEFRLEGFKSSHIETLIEEMYKKLAVPRRPDDRLRCEESGEDVFPFASLTLGQYVETGHCRCLVWLFAGGTGGALCL